MIYAYFALIVILVCALGYFSLRRRCKELQRKSDFAHEFSILVINYLESRGENTELINRAIMQSEKMQNEMGQFGRISYKMPFANQMIPNYPAILNILPSIKSDINDRLLGSDNLNQNVQILQNLVLRYIGHLDGLGESMNESLKNPMTWFREGLGNVISSPIWILGYFHIISEKSLLNIQDSKGYKIISGLLALGGVVVGLMQIIKQIMK